MDFLIRGGLLVAVWAAFMLVADQSADAATEGGADIGLGLAAFATVAAIGLVGGYLDGRRRGLGVVVLHWALAGVILAVFAVALTGIQEGFDARVLASDAIGLTPFLTLLVVAPAAAGAGLAALRPGVHRDRPPS